MLKYLVEWGKCCNFVGDFCMLSSLKYIIYLSLLSFLIGNFTSCHSWREAKEILVEADSLLANGVIMRDTAVLLR